VPSGYGALRFVVGSGLEEFKEYWSRSGYGKSLDHLINVVVKDPSQLIVWKEGDKIVGHSVWHETNTDEHRKGDPRDKEDKQALERLLGGKKSFVELHEVWLMEEYRERGYGREFFRFFEAFMRSRGYDDIVFYAHHPAALAICHERGYQEGGYLKELGEYVFSLSLKKTK
jgi:ribosomal protein S18 acetylase RimI-like enzyme